MELCWSSGGTERPKVIQTANHVGGNCESDMTPSRDALRDCAPAQSTAQVLPGSP